MWAAVSTRASLMPRTFNCLRFFFSSRRRHTRSTRDWSSDVCSSDLAPPLLFRRALFGELLSWTGEGCGKAVVQAHKHEAMYVDRPVTLLTDVDTPEDFAIAIAAERPLG